MTQDGSDDTGAEGSADVAPSPRLALLLSAAMFVLVVDTSLMNVSISAVVEDLDTTVSGVQSAIALEALVSAAFILISSKDAPSPPRIAQKMMTMVRVWASVIARAPVA